MKFQSIHLENFGAIGRANLNSLDSLGLLLLQGKNLDDSSADSNGAGKSSLPDALSWCLYGITAKGDSGDEVINRTAGKGCSVTIGLTDPADGSDWVVSRGRKHKTLKSKLWVYHNGVDVTKGTNKLTQEMVERLIGAPVDVFNAAIYSGQEKMPDLPGMTDRELKAIVEEAAGVTVLERAYVEARTRRGALEKEIESLVRDQDAKRQVFDDAKRRVDELTTNEAGWGGTQATKIETAQKALDEAVASLKAAQADAGRLTPLTKLNDMRAKVGDRINGVSGEKVEHNRLLAEQGNLINQQNTALNALNTARNAVKASQGALDRVEQIPGKPCGECGKLYCEDDVADQKARISAQLAREQENADKALSAYSEAEKRAQIAAQRVTDYESSMTDISKMLDARDRVDAEIQKHRDAGNRITRAGEIKDTCEANLATAQDEVNPYTAMLVKARERADGAKSELVAVTRRLIDQKQAMKPMEAACDVFSPAGVRGYILDEVTPFLNDRTAHYLGVLSDGNLSAVWSTIGETSKGEAREKFHIAATSTTAAESFRSLSGGEKRKVRLATSMALQDLVASRAEKPIGLYIADEIDDALDAAGLERLMAVLEEKAREKGTVIVVSHNPLRDWIRTSMTLVKEGGYSTLVEDAA